MDFLQAIGARPVESPQEQTQQQPASPEVVAEAQPVTEVVATEKVTEATPQVTPISEDEIISRLTGGAVTNSADFSTKYAHWQKLAERGEVDESQIIEKAYTNSFVKEINEMVKSGATSEQLIMHVELSQLGDISKLGNEDAIARRMAIEDGITLETAKRIVSFDSKTLEKFQEEFGDEEAEIRYQKYLIEEKRKGAEAKDYLKSKQKDIYENVTSKGVEDNSAKEAMKAINTTWQSNSHALKTTFANAGVQKIEIKDPNSGIEYDYEVRIPEEWLNNVMAHVPEFASSRGMALNSDNIAKVSQEVFRSYVSENFSAILESVARDAHAKAIKGTVEKQSNPVPVGGVQVHQPAKQTSTDPRNPSNFYSKSR